MDALLEDLRKQRKHIKRQVEKLETELEGLRERADAIENEYLPREQQLLNEYEAIITELEEKTNE